MKAGFYTGGSVLLTIWTILMGTQLCAQTKTVPIEQIDSLMQHRAKPILILLSTDWCTYCQMQKNQLSKNKDFKEAVDLFYYIPFDAESRGPVRFHHQDYTFKATGVSTGTHALALALNGPGKLVYPTWVLLDKNYQVLLRYQGVLSSQPMKELLGAVKELDR